VRGPTRADKGTGWCRWACSRRGPRPASRRVTRPPFLSSRRKLAPGHSPCFRPAHGDDSEEKTGLSTKTATKTRRRTSVTMRTRDKARRTERRTTKRTGPASYPAYATRPGPPGVPERLHRLTSLHDRPSRRLPPGVCLLNPSNTHGAQPHPPFHYVFQRAQPSRIAPIRMFSALRVHLAHIRVEMNPALGFHGL
jgi:hypothetical protein